MNLEDVIDPEYGLQQDEWSLSKPKFGEEGQLEVIGWSGKQKTNNARFYLLFCSVCSQDRELHGDGYFKMTKHNLNSGRIPCSCARFSKWTKDQWLVLCRREAENRGFRFIDFVGEWRGNCTRVRLSCDVHGEWDSTTIGSFFSGTGCPKCNGGVKKEDSVMIESFFKSGAFPEGTRFKRSSKVNKLNLKIFWEVYCPDCRTTTTSSYSNLQQGKVPCGCKGFVQDQAYINLVYDDNELVALKFGISSNSINRTKEINSQSCYAINNYVVYKFPTPEAARKAEKSCLQQLECGIVLKRDMPDGYTETTWSCNLEKIVEIYKMWGGIKIEN